MTPNGHLGREVLPTPDRAYAGLVTYDAKDPDTAFPPIAPLRPPAGAPNVLVVLLDDVGFGAGSAFGGPCAMPTAERLAADGLKYTRFHTTALCSPTRQALLTGRNHHTVGMGGITEIATSAPGYNSIRPNTCGPLAETLKLNGYATAQFGKCHEVPVWETSPMGPFDAWPTGGGGSSTSTASSAARRTVLPGDLRGDHPRRALQDARRGLPLHGGHDGQGDRLGPPPEGADGRQALLRLLRAGRDPRAAPRPAGVVDRYKGRFDEGWDELREQTIERQKALGVIPQDAELTARHAEIPAWDEMPDELKPVLSRQMEVYAAFLEYADHHVGRLIDALGDLGVLEDTLVYYIVGDNGASAEGTLNGTFNEMINFNGAAALETPEFLMERLDQLGGPDSYNHFPSAGRTRWTRPTSGRSRSPRTSAAPATARSSTGRPDRGARRAALQFHHVIDVAPTVLEAAGLPVPLSVTASSSGRSRASMAYSFDDAAAADRHETQYFEMFGNRGIYHQGWTAVTKHKTPWILVGETSPRSTTTSGSSMTRRRTGARRATSPRSTPRSCTSCSGCG